MADVLRWLMEDRFSVANLLAFLAGMAGMRWWNHRRDTSLHAREDVD